MNYENAADILPENLLKRVQKFAAGKLIYVPETIAKRSWGETSGYKRYLAERNQEIKGKFISGSTIENLADEYNLSVESIKKIVYTKSENKELTYKCSLSSAKEFAEAGKLEDWVHLFLLSDGHNKAFSDGLKLFDRHYLGPFTMPLSLFSRCCGPEDNMKYQVNAEWFEKRVLSLKKTLQSNDDKVGDEITLSGLLTDEPLNGGVAESDISLFYRKDVTVKVGAIIRGTDGQLISSRIGAACSVLTANEALDELGIPATYSVVSIYTDIDANNTVIANELQELGLDYPNMTFENWSSDVRTYKVYNLLVSIFSVTFIAILIFVTFTMLLIQLFIKTRLSLSTYTLYRINGLTFGKLIRSLILQLLMVYSVGVVLSVPMTWLLIKNGFNILNSITYYFSPLNFLSVILSVFVLMLVSFIPSSILLYKRKNNILLD